MRSRRNQENSASPVVEARSTPLVRREPGPLELAGLQLEQTRAQLKQIPTDPEFNGYHQIVKIAEQEEGLLYFHSLLGDDARFFAELERLKTEDASPLRQDLSALMSALEKPVVWAPIKVEDGGARQAAEAKKQQETGCGGRQKAAFRSCDVINYKL